MGETSMEVGVMPREMISSSNHGTNDHPAPLVQVAWGRETYVQVGVCYDDRPRVDGSGHVPRSEASDEIDSMRVTIPEGLWSDLNRDGINRLIRVLRKARDQAYGVDA